MGSRIRAIATLAGVVAALAWSANALITRVTSRWVEQDALRRAALAVNSANPALEQAFIASDVAALRRILLGIASDEQVHAVAACGERSAPLARTEQYP